MRFTLPAVACCTVLLSGCSFSHTAPANMTTADAVIQGRVFGGQQPISGATVTVYEVGTAGYGAGAIAHTPTTTTGPDGTFAFSPTAYTCTSPNAPTYIVAAGGNPGAGVNNNIVLMAGMGPCSAAHTEFVAINEVTTVATVYALAQFFNPAVGPGLTPNIGGPAAGNGTYTAGLVAAMENTLPSLVDISTGQAMQSINTTTNPATNVTITREPAKLFSLANTLAACVNSTGETSTSDTSTPCGRLFTAATPPGTANRPDDTAQAALMIALYPSNNVAALYNLAGTQAPFLGLLTAPNDWTVAMSYSTPNLGVGIGGTAPASSMSLDIDASGRVWFPSTKTGAAGLAFFDPGSISFNGPYNNGLVHPQYVAIDTSGIAWASDQGSNMLLGVNTASPGSLSSLSVPGASALGPVIVDGANNLVVTYPALGNVGLAIFPPARTTPTTSNILTSLYTNTGLADLGSGYYAGAFALPLGACTLFDNTTDPSGLWTFSVSTGGGCSTGLMTPNAVNFGGGSLSYGVMTATSSQEVCDDWSQSCTTPAVGLFAPEGIITDGNDNLWVANSANGSVSTFAGLNSDTTLDYATTATVPYIHNSTHGGTLTDPYAIGIDASGNVWTVSPGCVDTSSTPCTPTGMVLTQIVGAAGPTITPQAAASAAGIGTLPQS